MRYPDYQKATTRRRLLERGGSHAKKHGFAGSGMDALAAAAGVTTGSLYKHFKGKSEFFAELLVAELERSIELFRAVPAGDAKAANKVLAAYLSKEHAAHPERGCPLPALTAEVARADESVRSEFQARMLELHATIAERMTRSGDAAWGLIAQNVGAILLARAMLDPEAQKALLAATRRDATKRLKLARR